MVQAKLQQVTVNIGGSVRYAKMHGERMMVVPMVMMKEGVWAGSDGPLLYTGKHLANSCPSWNNKPVVIKHPKVGGRPTSAGRPEVLEETEVGRVLNAHYSDKQRAEAWLNEKMLIQKAPEVYDRIIRGQKVEVSTGLFVDQKPRRGSYGGKSFGAVACNHRPDHLAILPDEEGACSIADGAGLLANSGKKGMKKGIRHPRKMTDKQLANRVLAIRREFYKGGGTEYGVDMPTMRMIHPELASEHEALKVEYFRRKAAKKGFNSQPGSPRGNSKSTSNSKESIVATKTKPFNKRVMVDEIISNSALWEEDDRDHLNSLTHNQIGKILALEPTINEELEDEELEDEELDDVDDSDDYEVDDDEEYGDSGDEDDGDDDEEMEVNAKIKGKKKNRPGAEGLATGKAPPFKKGSGGKQAPGAMPTMCQSLESYRKTLPPEARDIFDVGLQTVNAQREELIGVITSNAGNQFSRKQLKQFEIDELQALAGLAAGGEPVYNSHRFAPDYSGAAGGPLTNSRDDEAPEPYTMPTINFKGNQDEDDD